MISNIWRVIQTQMPLAADEIDDPRSTSVADTLWKQASIVFYALALTAVIAWEAVQLAAPNGSTGKTVMVQLTRGEFPVLQFAPHHKKPVALVLFGTGDGGWSGFEEAVAKTLQQHGYETIGVDFNRYAKTDYSLDILQRDMDTLADHFRQKYSWDPPPVIMAGWSMGAAQAIATAGGPHPPRGLVGVLLLDPLRRGRYGLRLADQADVIPTGANTFATADFSKTMGNLRIVQWHASEDPIDSTAWLQTLTAPHREFVFAQTGHYYNRDRDDFLTQLIRSISWIVEPAPGAVTLTRSPLR